MSTRRAEVHLANRFNRPVCGSIEWDLAGETVATEFARVTCDDCRFLAKVNAEIVNLPE